MFVNTLNVVNIPIAMNILISLHWRGLVITMWTFWIPQLQADPNACCEVCMADVFNLKNQKSKTVNISLNKSLPVPSPCWE